VRIGPWRGGGGEAGASPGARSTTYRPVRVSRAPPGSCRVASTGGTGSRILPRSIRPRAAEEPTLSTSDRQPPDPQLTVPDWLGQSAGLGWRLLVVVAFGLVVLAGAALLGTVVASTVLAAALTAALDPLAGRLRASGRSPTVVAGIVTLAVAGLALAAAAVLAIAFIPAIADLLRAVRAGLDDLQRLVDTGTLPLQLEQLVGEIVDGVSDAVAGALTAVASSIAGAATIALLAVFLVFFFVNDADRAIGWTLQFADPRQRDEIAAAAATARVKLGRSLRETAGRAAIMGLVGLAVALVLGLPAPLALASIVFVGGFVPLLGLVTATALVGLVALGSSGLAPALVAVGVLAAAAVLLPRIVRPGRWQGHGVHPAVVLVALTVGLVVAGFAGLILAIPVVVVLREVVPAVIRALNGGGTLEPVAGIVPRWLDRIAQWSWRLLVLTAVGAVGLVALLQVPLIVVPLVIGGVLGATVAPGVGILLRRGASPTTASLALTIGGFGLVLGILILTVAALAGPVQEIAAESGIGAGTIDDLLGPGQSVASVLAAIVPEIVRAVAVVVAGLFGLAVSLTLGAILTFYLLRDGARGFEAATAGLSRWRHDELKAAATRATGILGGYMIGTGAISAFGALTQFAIMWILGIPLAGPLAVLSFFGGFIPYIGSLLTTGLAFLVTVATGDVQDILIMGIFTLVFNIVQGNIVAPLVYSRAVSIHPAVVLLAIPAGSAVAGIAGMFLAVPVIGVVATTWRTILRVFASDPPDRANEPGTDVDVEPAGAVSRAATT